jgi:hypothetical protein
MARDLYMPNDISKNLPEIKDLFIDIEKYMKELKTINI